LHSIFNHIQIDVPSVFLGRISFNPVEVLCVAHEDFHEELATLQKQYGIPRRVEFEMEMQSEEFALVQRSVKLGRRHDVTIFIRHQGKFVVIEKHAYAKTGIVRAPSGGAMPSEHLIIAARREAREETGFDVEIERFILESHVSLSCCDQPSIPWVSYVFLARVIGGQLGAEDVKEISGVQLRTREELLKEVGPLMLASGLGGFKYRAKMTEIFFEELDAQGIVI
jgi:8-oxo-dGTP pyrophosphatase MutT (NUDIX family)